MKLRRGDHQNSENEKGRERELLRTEVRVTVHNSRKVKVERGKTGHTNRIA